ncbi:hypothetical protein DUNSADRAFT_4063 [Dunaliella salina]|uniref:Glycosyl transferase CAP10 domain-containing protein n=1 Tax=Dunaliella salina TaxID=3046 RepID=A0ABQ7FUZ4_DUNSA|nr:hypothetical protein DUNSADRAFT_4063 [Dunaliella salina]|eukprot:KAF5826224.1 hypothetical protein DUNSADRAFT_4063 [Dunaliella salina]
MERGVQFPDVVFLYNALDYPLCQHIYTCDNMHVPPISVVGYNQSLLPMMNGSIEWHPFRKGPKGFGHGDLVISHFRFTGHSMSPSIHPHHPHIVRVNSKGDPLWSNKRQILRNGTVPWEQKLPRLFFRGKCWCTFNHNRRKYGCPRARLANLSSRHQDKLDIYGRSMPASVTYEAIRNKYRPREHVPMTEWSKYKYLAALDGIGASSRTIVLFHLGSVVVRQRRTGFTEWFTNSLQKGVHVEEVWHTDEDALGLVDKLIADDGYAHRLADAATAFAKKYLVKDVMMVYAKRLLTAYRDLFLDMDEYMQAVGDPGNSSWFKAQARSWRKDWRTVFPPAPSM